MRLTDVRLSRKRPAGITHMGARRACFVVTSRKSNTSTMSRARSLIAAGGSWGFEHAWRFCAIWNCNPSLTGLSASSTASGPLALGGIAEVRRAHREHVTGAVIVVEVDPAAQNHVGVDDPPADRSVTHEDAPGCTWEVAGSAPPPRGWSRIRPSVVASLDPTLLLASVSRVAA